MALTGSSTNFHSLSAKLDRFLFKREKWREMETLTLMISLTTFSMPTSSNHQLSQFHHDSNFKSPNLTNSSYIQLFPIHLVSHGFTSFLWPSLWILSGFSGISARGTIKPSPTFTSEIVHLSRTSNFIESTYKFHLFGAQKTDRELSYTFQFG